MSGIYIKGMEMPKDCRDCPCFSAEDVLCQADGTIDFQMSAREMIHAERIVPPRECPLIPIPPHGRLIDADVLFDFIRYIYKTAQGDARKAYSDVLCTIIAAGDVIPAEEGE